MKEWWTWLQFALAFWERGRKGCTGCTLELSIIPILFEIRAHQNEGEKHDFYDRLMTSDDLALDILVFGEIIVVEKGGAGL